MTTIGDRIKARRIELDMSQDELARLVGYKSRSSINKIESDGRLLPQRKIMEIANALNTTPAYIMGWEEVPSAHPFPTVLQPAKYRKYKVLGNIACGSPIDAVQEEGEYLETDLNVHADYVLKCQGDSMINARIFDGDYVFIREQAEVENGEIAAVWMDNTVTLKRFYRYDEYIELRAENPMFKPIIIHETDFDSIRVIGKAVACQFWIK